MSHLQKALFQQYSGRAQLYIIPAPNLTSIHPNIRAKVCD